MLAAPSGVAEASIAPGCDGICRAKPHSNWGACPTDSRETQPLESTCRAENRRPCESWEAIRVFTASLNLESLVRKCAAEGCQQLISPTAAQDEKFCSEACRERTEKKVAAAKKAGS